VGMLNWDRFGSSSDLDLNGNLHYPNDIDKSINVNSFILTVSSGN
jgi:hypothetical protein